MRKLTGPFQALRALETTIMINELELKFLKLFPSLYSMLWKSSCSSCGTTTEPASVLHRRT